MWKVYMIEKPKQIQCRDITKFCGLEHIMYQGMMRELGLIRLKEPEGEPLHCLQPSNGVWWRETCLSLEVLCRTVGKKSTAQYILCRQRIKQNKTNTPSAQNVLGCPAIASIQRLWKFSKLKNTMSWAN